MGRGGVTGDTLTFSLDQQEAQWELCHVPFSFTICDGICNSYKKKKENFNEHPCTQPLLTNYNLGIYLNHKHLRGSTLLPFGPRWPYFVCVIFLLFFQVLSYTLYLNKQHNQFCKFLNIVIPHRFFCNFSFVPHLCLRDSSVILNVWLSLMCSFFNMFHYRNISQFTHPVADGQLDCLPVFYS